MIPYNIEDIVEMQSTACFILVIEKESMFHKLLEEDLPNKLARPFIMITVCFPLQILHFYSNPFAGQRRSGPKHPTLP
jgi:hypothetical protein